MSDLIEQVRARQGGGHAAKVVALPDGGVRTQVPQYTINCLDDGIAEKISLVVSLPGELRDLIFMQPSRGQTLRKTIAVPLHAWQESRVPQTSTSRLSGTKSSSMCPGDTSW